MKPDGTTDKTRRHLLQTLPVLLGLLLTGCQPGSPPSQPAAAQPTARPDNKPSPPACPICGMPVIREESENFFEATIPNQPPVLLCSAVCAVVYTDRHPEVTRLDVFDYQRRTLVPAQTAFHLYESKLEVRAAMPPITGSFAVRDDAEAARKAHGGRVLTWTELRRAIRQTNSYKTSP
ncbi:nitrous oxide reductase accessory protein NosL [Chloracidobacterium thermophilum]|uniref:nitrous oxide reductase accessory protein NosL n=1 Tax=Chloracidobacterium thermophilum TaxID=458033 RepID=UPI0012FEB08F|nr:nitrous oxide reductase accessory protein NosL [Chloracidobacterium thermophilum]